MRHSIALLALSAALLSGCFFSPVGPNNAAAPAPTPDASGKVAVTYAIPEGVEATKVTFQVVEKPDVQVLDDSTEAVRQGSIDASALDPGVYTVAVLLNDETEPVARFIFVKPGEAAAPAEGETPAEGTQPAEGGETPAETTEE
jgi:hypothetical protein